MIKAIVTDIEGTTTSLSFVKDILFPYAKKNIAEFVRKNQNDPKVSSLINDVEKEAGYASTYKQDVKPDVKADIEQCIKQLIDWIDEDKKITPLKALQGLIWEAGYSQGDYTGHVYQDAYRQLSQWHEQGIKLYVYSSGSVYAQRLLYGYSDYSDMTPLFTDYFDTKVGAKTEINSYQKIIKSIALPGDEILFLSDITQELDAAKAAGMHTMLLERETNCTENKSQHNCVNDFSKINLDSV